MAPKAAAARTVWDDMTRTDLLQAIMDVCPPTLDEWQARGQGLDAEGVMRHAAPARTVWDDTTRTDLLQAIMDVCPPNLDEWQAVMALLHAKGYRPDKRRTTARTQDETICLLLVMMQAGNPELNMRGWQGIVFRANAAGTVVEEGGFCSGT
ncbi:Uu.00g139750.m01.CDS01 [Anthostomella pinea]|uniref:Uu.00g139750.m01.CDS01 n=1 Tax=Anthostomella pinea TaxID=933095 RepID=A0AAI8VQL8_9PEZI|nr:Uu.00g139750.m01.CDS01 [Anthostomella pinea]